jgi:hypothetical protein
MQNIKVKFTMAGGTVAFSPGHNIRKRRCAPTKLVCIYRVTYGEHDAVVRILRQLADVMLSRIV